MADDTIKGNLIVKGNIYFLGSQMTSSDTCNFDPLNAQALLPALNGKPSTVKNYIGKLHELDYVWAGNEWNNVSNGSYDVTYADVKLDNVYCTGNIYSIFPCRWFEDSGSTDTRQPSQGTVIDRVIKISSREATYPN